MKRREVSEDKLIGKMKVGEYGFTVPWAYGWPYPGGLNLDYSVHRNKGGTVNMMIEYLGRGKYKIDMSAYEDYLEEASIEW
jgi:hypothetical protein